MDISIIIVTYNTADLIGGCLDSVLASEGCNCEIIVVDNASQDDSARFIKERYPQVCLIENSSNRGFAAANNQALPLCKGRYLFFLNPDTTVKPDALRNAASFMDENPRIGLAGTAIVNPDGTHQESVSFRYPGERHSSGELSGLEGSIACVLGAAMIARPELIRKIGGFDEDFFLYGEDQDLCLRIRKEGYAIGFAANAVVTHLGGQSERMSGSADKFRKKVRAEYLFYSKHYLPRTTAHLRRIDLIKSAWRILTLKITYPFAADKESAQNKLTRYQVIYEELKKV